MSWVIRQTWYNDNGEARGPLFLTRVQFESGAYAAWVHDLKDAGYLGTEDQARELLRGLELHGETNRWHDYSVVAV